MTKEGTMRSSTTQKRGISLTLDESLLEWLDTTARDEALSISYLVNRFCSIAKDALSERVAFPDREQISNGIRREGLR